MTDFGAINTALTGLVAARDALDTSGQNVSNANTPGYVRERVDQTAVGGSVIPAWYATSGNIGQGVAVQGSERLANGYLDARSLAEHSTGSNLTTTQQVLQQAQLGFAEPSTNGISAQLTAFWSSWDNLANNPSDVGTRTALLGAASNLAASLNQAANGVLGVRATSTSTALSDVQQINVDATNIAQMNAEIASATAAGNPPNALMDQRDQLIQNLGELAGVTTRPGANGTVDVFLGSNALVRGSTAGAISGTTDSAGNVQLTWNIDGSPVSAGGSLGALQTAVNSTLPGLLAGPGGLDSVAAAVATAANTAQSNGVYWTQTPGSNPPAFTATAGPAMFAQKGGGAITAAGISVSSTLTAAQLAASSPTGGPNDGSNAQAVATTGTQAAGPDALYSSFIGNLGSIVAQVNNQVTVQGQVTQQVDSARSGAEGVNLDEEMSHMVMYQQAYTASAKFLNAVDQTLQTLLAAV